MPEKNMKPDNLDHALIVVEGPIGVGKTTLARRLATTLNAQLVLEMAEQNPFLERFYQDRTTFALPAQLHFLFQRKRQLEPLRQPDLFRTPVVMDYLLEKDRLFAEINLNEEELDLYQQVYQHLAPSCPTPDLVIYLQAPVEILMQRVRKRALPAEKTISLDYLKQISDAYTRFFHFYDDAPLLIVNASGLDLVENEAHYHALLTRIAETRSGRNYFNPLTI